MISPHDTMQRAVDLFAQQFLAALQQMEAAMPGFLAQGAPSLVQGIETATETRAWRKELKTAADPETLVALVGERAKLVGERQALGELRKSWPTR